MIRQRRIVWMGLGGLFAFAVPCAGAFSVEAVTRPSRDVTLSFTVPGMIDELCVPDGQAAGKGKPLARLDSTVEQAQVQVLLATRLANATRIEARKEQWEQAKVKLKMIEVAFAGKGATELNLRDAQLEVRIADIQYRLETLEQQKNDKEIARLEQEIKRMTLISPIDGRVEETFVKQGESVDRLTKVIRVVNTDTFHVEVMVPLDLARKLAVDEAGRPSVTVVFPGPERLRTAGFIKHVRAEADSGSDKVFVRVEVPNASGRKAGEHVQVEFKAPDAAAPASRPGQSSLTPAAIGMGQPR